jgi:uncharacterized protein (DUF433 family)
MEPVNPRIPRLVAAADLEGDLVRPGHPFYGIIWINPERMSGEPCFFGTRVPVKHLFDYLRGGHAIDSFLDDFPGVTREQVDAVLAFAEHQFHGQDAA